MGQKPGYGHSPGKSKKARLAMEISGGRYRNLRCAIEWKAGNRKCPKDR